MRGWLERVRRRWFPSKEERYADGQGFARRHFNGSTNQDELDFLYEGLPIEWGDPFDRGIYDVYMELSREATT